MLSLCLWQSIVPHYVDNTRYTTQAMDFFISFLAADWGCTVNNTGTKLVKHWTMKLKVINTTSTCSSIITFKMVMSNKEREG